MRQTERQRFERWYIVNADLERNPIGSRDCDLQWRAWAASKGLNSAGFPGTETGPHARPTGPNALSPKNPDAPWNRRATATDEMTWIRESVRAGFIRFNKTYNQHSMDNCSLEDAIVEAILKRETA